MSETEKTAGDELQLRDDWMKRARQQTMETLPAFMRELIDRNHDYGTIVHAIAACAVGAAWAAERSPNGGITGFQAGCVMWDFITGWMEDMKNKPLKLMDYEHLLFPQYEHNFRTISAETAKWIKDEATKRLASPNRNQQMHPDVLAHMEKVAAGWIPFGLEIER